MRTALTAAMFGCAALAFTSSSASAADVGFTMRFFGTQNPSVKVINKSDSAEITDLVMTIGDTSKNFDWARVKPRSDAHISSTLIGLDTVQGGLRSEEVNYTFDHFGAGDIFRFKTDIDKDHRNSHVNFRTSLFNLSNDVLENALVTVKFSDGTELSQNVPNFQPGDLMRFTLMNEHEQDVELNVEQTRPPEVVPLPAAAWTGMSLLTGIGVAGKLRRRK